MFRKTFLELGSTWQAGRLNRCVLVLGEDGSKRMLSLDRWDGDWNDDFRFLGVRK